MEKKLLHSISMEKALLSSAVSIAPVKWGRTSSADWAHTIGALSLIILTPTLVIVDWIALESYGGSLSAVWLAACEDPVRFLLTHLPLPTLGEVGMYVGWVFFQYILYSLLPGKNCVGQRTPGGYLLTYTTNGLLAWFVSHIVYASVSMAGLMDPAAIASHWEGLFAVANVCGFLLAGYVQMKGYTQPSFPGDCKVTGCWIFDFWGGIELNPQIGSVDLKFFFNGRPGIVAWTLIDISWAAYQYNRLGHVTSSMVVVNLLHALYVVDFFWNEEWYTRTVDISHDHFGFMLAWGDTTFLPFFYTLQAQYLARYSVETSVARNVAILVFGVLGYAIFRSANHQRYRVRAQQDDPNVKVWGAPATFIRCKYFTTDGKEHRSILLTSGWWGIARHANYLGDLMMAFAMCATCGFNHILPWSYFIYLFALLHHRAVRDERRCSSKYGKNWEEYCKLVPYLIVPGVY